MLTFLSGLCLFARRWRGKFYGLPAILEIDRNTPSEQCDALIWRLPAEQGIEWGRLNRGALRHYLECKSVKRLSGLSNH
jgi:hypothetical protein